jgi:hypothetical protein
VAQIIQVADAIVEQLNAATFSQPLSAVRGYLPTFELPEMSKLQVTVVPKEDDGRLDSRSSSAHDYAIDIGVQQKPENTDNAILDPLMQLVEEIADFFLFGKQLAGTTLISPRVRVLYLQEHLHKLRQFTSVITLTFRGFRHAA